MTVIPLLISSMFLGFGILSMFIVRSAMDESLGSFGKALLIVLAIAAGSICFISSLSIVLETIIS